MYVWVSEGCHNKTPQTEYPKQQRCIVLELWRLGVWILGVGAVGSLRLGGKDLFQTSLLGWQMTIFSLCLCTSPRLCWLRSTLMTLVLLDYFCKAQSPNKVILWAKRVKTPTYLSGRTPLHNSTHNSASEFFSFFHSERTFASSSFILHIHHMTKLYHFYLPSAAQTYVLLATPVQTTVPLHLGQGKSFLNLFPKFYCHTLVQSPCCKQRSFLLFINYYYFFLQWESPDV